MFIACLGSKQRIDPDPDPEFIVSQNLFNPSPKRTMENTKLQQQKSQLFFPYLYYMVLGLSLFCVPFVNSWLLMITGFCCKKKTKKPYKGN